MEQSDEAKPMVKYNQKIETLLVLALAKGATVAQAARQAGVSERTVYRRLQRPEFQARIQAIQDETVVRVASVLVSAAQEGIRVLVALQDKDTSASVRRAAARDVLHLGLRLREAAEIERRIADLENGAGGAAGGAGTSSAAPAAPRPAPPKAAGKRRRGDAILQAALASGDSVAQAALKAKLSERTVYRRLNDPVFQRGIEALRAEMVQRAAALLNAASMLATKTLLDLQDQSMPASVRRSASRDIIELGRKLRESVFLEKRLAALEEQWSSDEAHPPPRRAS
jgi:transposase